MAEPASSFRPLRFIAGAAIATVVVLGGAHQLLAGELIELTARRDQRIAVVSLSALTHLVRQASATPAPEGAADTGDALRAAAAEWQKQSSQVKSLRVVRFAGIALEASTAAGDVGDQAAPRRLSKDEKAIYDQGQRLRAAFETNRDEGVGRKDEIEFARRSDGTLAVAGPLSEGDAVVGVVEVVVGRGEPLPPPNLGWALGLAVAATGVVAALALLLARRKNAVDRWVVGGVGAAAVAGVVLAHGSYARATIADARTASASTVSAQALRASEIISATCSQAKFEVGTLLPGNWDTDQVRHPLGELLPDGHLGAPVQLGPAITRPVALLTGCAVLLFVLVAFGAFHLLGRTLRENRVAYAYITPAMVGMVFLVFFPFLYGITLSFTDSNLFNANKSIAETFVGLRNYGDILFDFNVMTKSAEGGYAINYGNFYWTLIFTVIWTVSNVTIGVTVGLALALALNIKNFAFRPIYRVLLILPWAVPNYITALIWKGMFHRQFGVANQMLMVLGFEPISWFDAPFSSFFTALATNSWLSFPFMMVVSLGALQSIPDDLYEAAEVDGASRWQQLYAITLPALRPALVPAIILSVVWTFNMFNIVYLVTGGEPGGATEILITQAYKHAFERNRYGYAAAYSTVIFLILVAYGVFQNRVSRATEA